MPKIVTPAPSGVSEIKDFIRSCVRFLDDVLTVINGKVEFDKNIASQTVVATFPTANTTVFVSHDLNRTGLKYFVCDKSAACDVFHIADDDSTTMIALQSTVAGATVSLVLF